MNQAQLTMLRHLQGLAKGEKLFRPSSISRLFVCPGSLIASLRSPYRDRSSPEAREGTAAHTLASETLLGKFKLDKMEGQFLDLKDGGPNILVTEEMVDTVQMYLDEITERWTPDTEMFVEQKMSLAQLDPNDPLFTENAGTGDCILIDRKLRTLKILDLKYGKGIMVKGDSPQLKNYALMAALNFPNDDGWAEIETVIVQPRAREEHQRVKPFKFDAGDLLMGFIGELVGAMEAALNPDAMLTPGDHCRSSFCPARPTCPALREQAINLARDEFAAVPMETASSALMPVPQNIILGSVDNPRPMQAPGSVVLPQPIHLSVDEIATILSREPIWDAWITGIKQYAVKLIEAGTTVPGYKLVARSGHRAWIDPDAAQEVLFKQGLRWGDVHAPQKMLSPAQVEKKLPAAKRAIVATLTQRPLGQPVLTRAADEREAVAALFGPIE